MSVSVSVSVSCLGRVWVVSGSTRVGVCVVSAARTVRVCRCPCGVRVCTGVCPRWFGCVLVSVCQCLYIYPSMPCSSRSLDVLCLASVSAPVCERASPLAAWMKQQHRCACPRVRRSIAALSLFFGDLDLHSMFCVQACLTTSSVHTSMVCVLILLWRLVCRQAPCPNVPDYRASDEIALVNVRRIPKHKRTVESNSVWPFGG